MKSFPSSSLKKGHLLDNPSRHKTMTGPFKEESRACSRGQQVGGMVVEPIKKTNWREWKLFQRRWVIDKVQFNQHQLEDSINREAIAWALYKRMICSITWVKRNWLKNKKNWASSSQSLNKKDGCLQKSSYLQACPCSSTHSRLALQGEHLSLTWLQNMIDTCKAFPEQVHDFLAEFAPPNQDKESQVSSQYVYL